MSRLKGRSVSLACVTPAHGSGDRGVCSLLFALLWPDPDRAVWVRGLHAEAEQPATAIRLEATRRGRGTLPFDARTRATCPSNPSYCLSQPGSQAARSRAGRLLARGRLGDSATGLREANTLVFAGILRFPI